LGAPTAWPGERAATAERAYKSTNYTYGEGLRLIQLKPEGARGRVWWRVFNFEIDAILRSWERSSLAWSAQ